MQIPLVRSIPQVLRLPVSSSDQVANPKSAHQVHAHSSIPEVKTMPGVVRITVPDEIAIAMSRAKTNLI